MKTPDVIDPTEPVLTGEPFEVRPGDKYGERFELERLAGRGGMGAVWRARDLQTGEPVAVKILLQRDEGQVARFEREARLLSELRHPGIARHVAHGVTEHGRYYLVMEWLEGENLAERIARGPLDVDDCLLLVERVAEALGVVHARGIVHRDVKPANLFLPGGNIEHVKVLDFGIAREPDRVLITAEGLAVGTPAYMSPEQAQADPDIDPRSDVFSLGTVLYECLAGRPAFDAPHVIAVLAKVMFCEPIPISNFRRDITDEASALLRVMLSKDRSSRPRGGADLAELNAGLRARNPSARGRLGLGVSMSAMLGSSFDRFTLGPWVVLIALPSGGLVQRSSLAWLDHLGSSVRLAENLILFADRMGVPPTARRCADELLRRALRVRILLDKGVMVLARSAPKLPHGSAIDRATGLLDQAIRLRLPLRGIGIAEDLAAELDPSLFQVVGDGPVRDVVGGVLDWPEAPENPPRHLLPVWDVVESIRAYSSATAEEPEEQITARELAAIADDLVKSAETLSRLSRELRDAASLWERAASRIDSISRGERPRPRAAFLAALRVQVRRVQQKLTRLPWHGVDAAGFSARGRQEPRRG